MSFANSLDTPLLNLSAKDSFTLRDACNGVHIFGGIGSGKTSGSGKTLAGAYLRAGMGGLVLCAKPEEVNLWLDYAHQHGRRQSVILFDENRGFNFIDYELARQGTKGISNVTECLLRVLEAADQATGRHGGTSDQFWVDAIRQILNYTIPAIYSAYTKVTVSDIIYFVSSASTKPEQLADDNWVADSYYARTLRRVIENPQVPIEENAKQSLLHYWSTQYPAIPEKTRGNMVISLSTRLDRFRHGSLQKSFCGNTDIVPEMTFHGAIIIMNMPALTWNEDGIIGQQLFKFMWQRAVESRNGLDKTQHERPVFLWADEAQYFANLKDDQFLSTCRGSRACVVFLTQTLPSYYAVFGRDKSDAADGLVGKFNTQIFHQNACNRTNHFASEMIGRALQLRNTTGRSIGTSQSEGLSQGSSETSGHTRGNSGYGKSGGSGENIGSNIGIGRTETFSTGASEQMDYLVQPMFFASNLKSGGKKHGNQVSALWFKVGGHFQNAIGAKGGNTLHVTFRQ